MSKKLKKLKKNKDYNYNIHKNICPECGSKLEEKWIINDLRRECSLNSLHYSKFLRTDTYDGE